MEKEKYKVGDILVCQPGWDPTDKSGGAGYANGRVFKVREISRLDENPENVIYWPEKTEKNTCGIYGRAVKKAEVIINNYPIY